MPEHPLSLAELNAIHWAWLGSDYHATKHETTQRLPKEHFLEQVEKLRRVPRDKNLDEVFLHRAMRDVRKDGTVRWNGLFLEVRPELVDQKIELRFDPIDESARPRVFKDDRFYCDTSPLDRIANASRLRKRIASGPTTPFEPTGLDPLGDLLAEHYDRVRVRNAQSDDLEE